jgi:tungstate transport system ATP-binding protein
MSLIRTVDVGQSYDGRSILKNINLSINRGDVLAIIGPTGAGKTTLLRILDLLERPYSGQVYFDEVEISKSKKLQLQARRRMAYVHQKPVTFTTNVFNNVAYALKWRHVKKALVRSKTEDVLELVGLAGYEHRNAKTLSGGETQRLAIARALVTEPEVLFLDEPTANMDPISVSKIEEVLAHVIEKKRTTVVMATHDMSQGQRLARAIGVIINGELAQIGTPIEIFTMPKSKEVAEFVGVENILNGEVVGKEGELTNIKINGCIINTVNSFNVGEKVYILIRPEVIVFSLSADATSARNVLKGKVNSITTVGHMVRLEVDCGFSLLGTITKHAAQDLNITIGKEVYASFKATAIHTIKRYM